MNNDIIDLILSAAEQECLALSMAKDRAGCNEFRPPSSPGDYLFWIEDESQLQEGQCIDCPDEMPDRIEYAAKLAYYAKKLRCLDVIPIMPNVP